MSLLGLSNRILFQWFCVRLTKHQEEKIEQNDITGYDIMPDGAMCPRGIGKIIKYQWYSIQYWILPTTGWGKDYVYLNTKPKFLNITKPKKI